MTNASSTLESTLAPEAGDRRGFWANLPRGATLSEEVFLKRHRVISAILVGHLPVLAVIGYTRGFGGLLLWGQLGAIAGMLLLGRVLRGQAGRAGAISIGLMIAATATLHVGGGLTDLHIWFYVVLALIALYQSWTPFLLSVVFVAVHHIGLSLALPESVFSTPQAQEHPIPYALLQATFLLAEATLLAYAWKFTEAADAERELEWARGEVQQAAEAQAREELAAERTQAADDADARLRDREEQAVVLERQVSELRGSGDRLNENVSTATTVMDGLRSAIAEIAAAASSATSTAQEANAQSQNSAATIERLSTTMAEIDQIAGSISSIADQTNLLALNATIESARAGEAGKGFAVVAGEVKDLAQETARATERIRRVVDAVRTDVSAAGSALTTIQEIIQGVVDAQTTIAAAVEQQSASTVQAQEAISGAAHEAGQMAQDLQLLTV